MTRYGITITSISTNADGPRDAASRKIHHIALPTKYNLIARQRASVDSKLLHRPRTVGYYHFIDLLSICYTSKFATNTVTNRTDGA